MDATREHRQGTGVAPAGAAPPVPPRDDDRGSGGERAAAAPTTSELLAQLAEPSSRPVPRHDPSGAGRFVAWLLGCTVLACMLLLAVLWWLDPISVTGRQTRFSVVDNGGVRQAKLDLMEELPAAPDVLLLGSSRSMKLDPRDVRRISGATAFNAAVSGGTARDMYLYARYADTLWPREGEFPHLVLGVVNDVLRDSGTALHDPRLKQFLPRSRRSERDALQAARELLQVKTLEAAVRAVRIVVPRDGLGSLAAPQARGERPDAALARPGRQKGNQRDVLTARGMQLPDPRLAERGSLPERIREQMTVFVDRSFRADGRYEGVDPAGLQMLVRTIRLANRRGDVPTLWVTPFHPDARRYLPDAHAERDERFRDAVARLERDPNLRFEFIDLSDIRSFDGRPEEFEDGIHMTPANGARVLSRLHEDGVLAPGR